MSACRNLVNAFTMAISAGLLSACADQPSQQVWSTKNQSMLGAKTDTPSLSAGDVALDVGAAPTAAELREPAISLLLQAADSTNPLLRANAIEALHHAPERLEPVVQRALGDPNRGVRFVATMTAGKFQLHNLVPLIDPLRHDESPSVQAAALYALRRCGRAVDLNPLSAMLVGEDPEVKGNAAFVLGELGDNSAVALLRHTAGRGLERVHGVRRKIVELQLAEALVKLGSMRELHVIRAALYAPAEEAELSALACQICGELKDGSSLADLTNIVHRSGNTQRPPEVRMAAALAAARINPDREFVEVPVAYIGAARPEWRAQAAHTLGAMKSSEKASRMALAHLARLMNDPSPMVQVAAAGGILQMQPPAFP